MMITLLRDGEFIEVFPEDLKSGLKVEDKGRYFLFSMPGKDDVVLGSDITMPYNPPLRRIEAGGTLDILCIGQQPYGRCRGASSEDVEGNGYRQCQYRRDLSRGMVAPEPLE